MDYLHVRLPDEEIRAAVLQALMCDSDIPAELIDVRVNGGWVTLTAT